MSVFNKETAPNLDRSLRSVYADQKFKPDQIVLVEDGELTVDLYAVIEKWRCILGDKLVTPQNETNQGLTASLNKGLEYATGDLIARNDSDDYSAPDRFEVQVKFLEEHPEIDIVGSSIQEFDETNECLGIRNFPTDNIKSYMSKATPVAHPTVMMRSKIFKEYGLRYDGRYPLNEDIALWYDAVRAGCGISNVPDVLYHFSCGRGMYERRSREKAGPEFRVYARGIYDLYGPFTYRYIYPVVRWIFRMLPVRLVAKVYGSKTRKKFLTQ